MSGNAHIVDFDQARRASGRVRPTVSAARRAETPKQHRRQPQGSRSAERIRSAEFYSAAPRMRSPYQPVQSADQAERPHVRQHALRTDGFGNIIEYERPTAAATRAKRSEPRASARPSSRSASVGSTRRERNEDDGESEVDGARRETVRSKLEKERHDKRKRKADRAFDKTVRQEDASGGSQSSRAAVYQTRMGSSHKRAARMQQSKPAVAYRVGWTLRGLGQKWRASTTAIVATCVVLCIALCVAFVYPSAQQYYTTVRDQAKLEAQYTALTEHNDTLQAQVDSLGTADGMEAQARSEFGWVKSGENAVVVTGLDTQSDGFSVVSTDDIQAPDTWYSGVLDVLFRYNQG